MRIGKRMFFWFSFLLLSVTSIYCFSFVCSFAIPVNAVINVESNNSTFKANTSSDSSITQKEESKAKTSSSAVSSAAVTAASKGKAKGKIKNIKITESAANLKYQKIYVKNGTSVNINLKTELLAGPKLRLKNTQKPQVLIVHTHTTESYMTQERTYYTDNDKTRSTNDDENIVAVGKVLKSTLEAKGIGVVHAAERHDYPEYTGAYSRTAETIKKYLKKYPTVKVVIDLHRDSMTESDGTKKAVVTTINGKKAAQVMLVSGCQDGAVTGFPNWRENFRLAIKLQQTMEVMYPSLARPILFTARKYNQNITTGSLLIECGTDANTLKQAKYSATLVGNALASTLNTLK